MTVDEILKLVKGLKECGVADFKGEGLEFGFMDTSEVLESKPSTSDFYGIDRSVATPLVGDYGMKPYSNAKIDALEKAVKEKNIKEAEMPAPRNFNSDIDLALHPPTDVIYPTTDSEDDKT